MCTNISSTRLSRSLAGLSKPFYYIYTHVSEDPITPCLPKQTRFGLFPVRSPLLRESLLFSLPMGTKMFQFPTFALSLRKCRSSSPAGCPIRKSADRVVCANPRSLSQLITSFFAPESLGIHRLPSLYFFARIYILLHISSPLLHVEYTVIEFLPEVALRLRFNALLSFLFLSYLPFRCFSPLTRGGYNRMALYSLLFLRFFNYVKDRFPCCYLLRDNGIVENIGFEPMTPCLQNRCSSQLS